MFYFNYDTVDIGCVSKYGIVVKFNLSYFGYVNIILQMVFFVFLLITYEVSEFR